MDFDGFYYSTIVLVFYKTYESHGIYKYRIRKEI